MLAVAAKVVLSNLSLPVIARSGQQAGPNYDRCLVLSVLSPLYGSVMLPRVKKNSLVRTTYYVVRTTYYVVRTTYCTCDLLSRTYDLCRTYDLLCHTYDLLSRTYDLLSRT